MVTKPPPRRNLDVRSGTTLRPGGVPPVPIGVMIVAESKAPPPREGWFDPMDLAPESSALTPPDADEDEHDDEESDFLVEPIEPEPPTLRRPRGGAVEDPPTRRAQGRFPIPPDIRALWPSSAPPPPPSAPRNTG